MNDTTSSDQSTTPVEISCQEVRGLMDRGIPFLFIDCREPWENSLCSLGGELISMGDIENRVDWFRQQSKRLIVYCHHGRRSLIVANYLRKQGVSQVQSMAGGIDRWSREVDPQVPTY